MMDKLLSEKDGRFEMIEFFIQKLQRSRVIKHVLYNVAFSQGAKMMDFWAAAGYNYSRLAFEYCTMDWKARRHCWMSNLDEFSQDFNIDSYPLILVSEAFFISHFKEEILEVRVENVDAAEIREEEIRRFEEIDSRSIFIKDSNVTYESLQKLFPDSEAVPLFNQFKIIFESRHDCLEAKRRVEIGDIRLAGRRINLMDQNRFNRQYNFLDLPVNSRELVVYNVPEDSNSRAILKGIFPNAKDIWINYRNNRASIKFWDDKSAKFAFWSTKPESCDVKWIVATYARQNRAIRDRSSSRRNWRER